MTNKKKYIEFYLQHPDICIFSAPWWLDAVAGADNWDVILVERGNQIVASFPFVLRKLKLFFGMAICQPILTQKLGPYIYYNSDSMVEMKKIGYENDIYESIINSLPNFSTFSISFNQDYKNWLVFYWHGFEQTTRYSYRIFNIKHHELVFNNYAKSKKQKIKKAKNLLLKFDLDFHLFYDYFETVIQERGETVSYTREQFVNLCSTIYENNAGRIFYCEDEKKNIHAINLTVWDKKTAYYLVAMRKAEYKTSGGTEFLVDETIKYASQFVDVFDFEGSMIPGVEESFRWYGAIQTEYYTITKQSNPIIPFLKSGRDVLRWCRKRLNRI